MAHCVSIWSAKEQYDMLIAAVALANDLIVVTHNVGEFGRIVGLKIEDWEV